MKRLVLLGEGQGDVGGLPVLIGKLLHDKCGEARPLYIDKDVIRAHNADALVKWNKDQNQEDYSQWFKYLRLAARDRRDLCGVLAVIDGDSKTFPAGKKTPFCAVTAAKTLALAAKEVGAGATFSLAVVFACVEYETWLVAGAGKPPIAGTEVLFPGKSFPGGDPESHGKGWIERNMKSYRPTRDQARLTELLDLDVVRAKRLRSFGRLENAMDQLLKAVQTGNHIVTP
jgi:hypothetical protein